MKVGVLATMISLLLIGFPVSSLAGMGADGDGDGIPDSADKCVTLATSANCDTDGDGYGNACDGDFDQDFVVIPFDFQVLWLADFNAASDSGIGSDMDCDGVVIPADFLVNWLANFSTAKPGPSGLLCAGQPGCN